VSPPPVSPPPPPPVSPPPVSPPPPSGTIVSHGYGDVLVGSAGADTLVSYQGGETMTGGGGADTFVFKTVPWTPTHIADFQLGVDKLDFSGLYTDGYKGADPVADGYVRFESDGAGGTAVIVDPDGRATGHLWGDYVVDLEHVSSVGLTSAQLFGGSGSGSPPPPVSPPPIVSGRVRIRSTPARGPTPSQAAAAPTGSPSPRPRGRRSTSPTSRTARTSSTCAVCSPARATPARTRSPIAI
jgi:hypothetical protein